MLAILIRSQRCALSTRTPGYSHTFSSHATLAVWQKEIKDKIMKCIAQQTAWASRKRPASESAARRSGKRTETPAVEDDDDDEDDESSSESGAEAAPAGDNNLLVKPRRRMRRAAAPAAGADDEGDGYEWYDYDMGCWPSERLNAEALALAEEQKRRGFDPSNAAHGAEWMDSQHIGKHLPRRNFSRGVCAWWLPQTMSDAAIRSQITLKVRLIAPAV